MTPSLSIVVASSGRDTLGRTIESARSQMRDGDEVLVSVNQDCPWGNKARNQLMQAARCDYLLFMDDDDIYTPDALDTVRGGIDEWDSDEVRVSDFGNAMHLFKMRYDNGFELWQSETVRCGNVSTQMIAVPSIARLFASCRWGDRYEGDFDFISACARELPLRWHRDVIALVRPA